MSIKEVWKEVKGYEGLYEVSDLGRVRSLDRWVNRGRGLFLKRGKVLKGVLCSSGYLKVTLCPDSGKREDKTIHTLVAIAFKGHVPNGYALVIDHDNNIKTDNRDSNIKIVTARKNTSKDRVGGSSKYTGVSWHKGNKKWVAQIHINEKRHLGYFANEEEAAKAYQKSLKELCTQM